MADRPSARDEDRLPWLEPFGDGEKKRTRKPVSRTALVGLLVAFFGVGLAVAFLAWLSRREAGRRGTRADRRSGDDRSHRIGQYSAGAACPLAGSRIGPASSGFGGAGRHRAHDRSNQSPWSRRRRPAKAKARKRATKRKPILRPFINIKKRPAPTPAPAPAAAAAAPPPVRAEPVIPFTPKGRVIQLGAYSTQKQADKAYRTLVWRYPYLKTRPKVIAPTQPVGGWRYYRLRLGTETQAQSVVICQHLQAKGQSCIVIY